MKKLGSFLFLFLLCISASIAQNKNLAIEDIFNNRSIYPKNMYSVEPHFSNDYFSYVNDEGNLMKIDTKGKISEIVKLAEINKALKSHGYDYINFLYNYKWISEKSIAFSSKNNYLEYDINTKFVNKILSWNEKAENIEFCTKSGMAVYTVDNNIYITKNGLEKAITTDGKDGIVNGKTVHRNEFGIEKGVFCSPQENKIAFYRMDESMVSNYPLVDINTRIAEVKNVRYPMAGMKSHEVTLGVYDVASGKTVFMKTGEPAEQYLTAVTWDPSEKYIYIGILNREQNHLKLNKYDVSTGDFVQTLFEEKNARYVEPENPMFFRPNNSNQFLWMSERDGFMHLYLYESNGKLVKQITSGNWMVTSFEGFDASGSNIWFYGTKNSPIENHAYSVNIDDLKMTNLTSEKGTHKIVLSKNQKYLIDSYNSSTIASKYQLKTFSGKFVKELLKDENPLKDYNEPQLEIFTLKSEDGSDLYCEVIKPADFDPNKKYPVMIYVYGGPHAQLVTESWTGGAGYFNYYMASKGYIVFTLDNRGSANRGFEFESCIHRNLGTKEVDDQMVGVNWLKNQKYVDSSRLGVFGWSYGGFMTISLMTKHSDEFKAAVAGGPVIDWKYYEVMYGERYMDTPDENPDGYNKSSLLNHIENLKGRLLIIQGYQDETVVPQHCLSFIEASIKKGKQIDLFVYPNHEHNVGGIDRMHLYKKVEQYFDDHLYR